MNRQQLRALLDEVHAGTTTPEAAPERLFQFLSQKPYEDLGFARVDHHRNTRQGFPEVVFGLGKTPSQIAEIPARSGAAGHSLRASRTSPEAYQAVLTKLPAAQYHDLARCITLDLGNASPGRCTIVIAAPGPADLPIAEEAVVTASLMGNRVDRLYDVGVAGLHRLLQAHPRLHPSRAHIRAL